MKRERRNTGAAVVPVCNTGGTHAADRFEPNGARSRDEFRAADEYIARVRRESSFRFSTGEYTTTVRVDFRGFFKRDSRQVRPTNGKMVRVTGRISCGADGRLSSSLIGKRSISPVTFYEKFTSKPSTCSPRKSTFPLHRRPAKRMSNVYNCVVRESSRFRRNPIFFAPF